MHTKNIATPKDLAEHIVEKLKLQKGGTTIELPEPVLNSLFDCLFYASLHTEEGDSIKITVTLFNTDNRLKHKSRPTALDTWNFYPFENPLAFNISTIVKLAKAADPWSTSIAVYYDKDNVLWIHGMIDQAIHSQSYINFEKDTKPNRPGLFETTILGIGTLSVMKKFELLATLKQEKLVTKYIDVLKSGPVANILTPLIKPFEDDIAKLLSELKNETISSKFKSAAPIVFRRTISRILNKVREYQHGGSLLISDNTKNLEIKYRLRYDRLPRAIQDHLQNSISHRCELENGLKSVAVVPSQLSKIEELRKKSWDAKNELKGAITFIASQSCVDGLVVIDKSLIVLGFGAVIENLKIPETVYISSSSQATKFTSRDTDHYGTRHRSMFAYCNAYKGSLGFVISQDGDIRVVTKIKDKVVMWEDIKTQKSFRSKPKSAKSGSEDINK